MSLTTEYSHGLSRPFVSPIIILIVAIGLLPVLLLGIDTVPIGSMYWDLFLYFDAANRIFDGQVPNVDFFTPVGPLGYYLFSGALAVFPEAQPLLLVEWSLFVVSAPLMALVILEVDRTNRAVAYGILLPFLFFAILPFNVRDYYIFAGSDGFGIYNRQAAVLLYILVASLVFVRSQRLLGVLVALCMLALFLLKITAFSVAGLICVFALLAGRLHILSALASGLAFLIGLAALELHSGIISAYIGNIQTLLSINSVNVLAQLASKSMQNLKILLPAGLLILLLICLDWRAWLADVKGLARQPGPASLSKLLDKHACWLAVVLAAGLLFESQNFGSQDMIYTWPVLLAAIADPRLLPEAPNWRFTARLLAFAAIIPVTLIVAERAGRASTGALRAAPLEHEHLKTVGAVSVRPFRLNMAETFAGIYPAHRETYEAIAAAEVLPSFVLFNEFKHQIGYLIHMDDAIGTLKAMEADQQVRFETLFHLSFTNPFPWLMDRSAPKHVAIGADPFRAIPAPDDQVVASVSDVDIALYPTCPVIQNNVRLLEIYGDALNRHRRIQLTSCYDAFVHPRIAPQIVQ